MVYWRSKYKCEKLVLMPMKDNTCRYLKYKKKIFQYKNAQLLLDIH